tara:strand:- start:333 stop:764 length:432 start_codon:yes stop_codon:yes gene_type:complete
MIKIAKTFKFSMGHTLWKYEGNCHNFHGHNYRLEVILEGRIDSDTDMVLDYAEIKKIMEPIIDKYDHKFAISKHDKRLAFLQQADRHAGSDSLHIMETDPTAESISGEILAYIIMALMDLGFRDTLIPHVRLWETDDAYVETF